MHELELKFSVPNFTQVALDKQMSHKTAQRERLSAYYFDTPEHDLAKHGIALRIRYEDNQWVQTLKTQGDGVAKRVELNNILELTSTPSDIDLTSLSINLALIDNGMVSKQLAQIMPIEQLQAALVIQYYTDIERTSRIIKKNTSRIEIAYDRGIVGILASKTTDNSKTSPLKQYDIHEIEFELLEGNVNDLVDVAKTWCKRYKLYLSTITKAHRGNLLLANQTFAPPTKADLSLLNLDKNVSQFDFLQQVVNNCLAQILPNASAISEGSLDGNHVHQLRVGIRRLRTALKTFKNFAAHANYQIDPNCITVLKQTFGILGEYRDREILKFKTQPMLEAQGSPHVEWSTDVGIMPIDAVRANDFQIVLLDLIALTHLPISITEKINQSSKAKPILAKKLEKLFNTIVKASDNFAQLDVEQQHDIRKDLKTLRYVSEFAAPLFKGNSKIKKGKKQTRLDAFLRYLEPAQAVLGDYNDNVVGHAYYQQKATQDPKALFAVGWFGGQASHSAEVCAISLKTLKNAPKFW